MKIGVSTLAINNDKLYDDLKFFNELNIDYIEILQEYPNSNINVDLLNSFDFKYTIHSPIIDLNIASLNKSIQLASINEIIKSIDLAKTLDSDIVVVHPGSIPFLARNYVDKVLSKCRESLVICENYGSDYDVHIAVENMPNIDNFLYKDINTLNRLLFDLDIGMTLDVGHAAVNGFSEKELYFDSIKHVHLSDNNYDNDMHYSLGEGSIDFKAVIKNFEKNNYNGIFVIEVNDKESVLKSLEYLENL
ncbi:sugar phosphate isomerase/epimerase family protein [Methanobrevibacter sp.]|uniref:sugar phosphate isomerase/epimerase family protein n=1 Tax=Methanobrevibacter sp. TaxID=66852 RepID=UPI00262F5C2A|nr:sugar phosphate isomerase/epimerase [uncultured Methanobrevibacter sp.]